MKAFIEQIGLGHKEWRFLGIHFKEKSDVLMISNGKPYAWIFSLITGYKQMGVFRINRPHTFSEREWVEITIENDKIVSVEKSKEGLK